jgi:hypothetical protein
MFPPTYDENIEVLLFMEQWTAVRFLENLRSITA